MRLKVSFERKAFIQSKCSATVEEESKQRKNSPNIKDLLTSLILRMRNFLMATSQKMLEFEEEGLRRKNSFLDFFADAVLLVGFYWPLSTIVNRSFSAHIFRIYPATIDSSMVETGSFPSFCSHYLDIPS